MTVAPELVDHEDEGVVPDGQVGLLFDDPRQQVDRPAELEGGQVLVERVIDRDGVADVGISDRQHSGLDR